MVYLHALPSRSFERRHLVRVCALRRQLKPVILNGTRHSSNSLAAKQIRKTWVLCYFMLWLPQKKGWGRVPKDQATIENVTFNANQSARGLGVLFNISGRSCGCVWKLRDFFVQYLKFWASESNKNWQGRHLYNILFISCETS